MTTITINAGSRVELSVSAVNSNTQVVVTVANNRIEASGNDYSTPLSNGATYYDNAIEIETVEVTSEF